jgi:hypothetical protein
MTNRKKHDSTKTTASKVPLGISCLLAIGLCSPVMAETYRLTFTGVWDSSHIQAESMPDGAHLTSLYGATHTPGQPFWSAGEDASLGVQNVAENGDPTDLMNELSVAINSGIALTQVSSDMISEFPGSSSVMFEVSESHPNVSFVSMIAPSPDWFVGISDVSLRQDGAWINQVNLDLVPWDAGTKNGSEFAFDFAPTNPQQGIAKISGMPFINTPVIANISIERVMVSELPACEAGIEPNVITLGDEAGFWWWTDGAPSVYINNGFGQVDVADNWVWVTPTETTTYSIEVMSESGVMNSCSATVVVENDMEPSVPVCEAGVEPQTIIAGDEAGFWWWTDGASSVYIDNGFGQVNVSDDWVWITPTETTTYNLIVKNANGVAATCNTTVIVE